jgi:hypothetical protein
MNAFTHIADKNDSFIVKTGIDILVSDMGKSRPRIPDLALENELMKPKLCPSMGSSSNAAILSLS